ncbi:5366_t:CDS:2, partial [Racocetra fulgida]
MTTKAKRHNLRSNSPNNLKVEELNMREELEKLQLAFDEIDELEAADLSASQLILFSKIWDDIKEKDVEKINWNDMRSNYNDARDKEAFINDFQENWLIKRDRAVAKNQNCELDD